jgi:signal transduction histidine kinase
METTLARRLFLAYAAVLSAAVLVLIFAPVTIAHESIKNVVRHADAKRLDLTLRRNGGGVLLVVVLPISSRRHPPPAPPRS